MTVTKSTTVQIEQGQNRSCGRHALDQMTFVVRFAVRFGAKDGAMEKDVDGMVKTATTALEWSGMATKQAGKGHVLQGHNMTWRGIWRKVHGQ